MTMNHGIDTRAKYILYCESYAAAANYATKQRWHMNDWRHLTDDVSPGRVIVFVRERKVDPNFENLQQVQPTA